VLPLPLIPATLLHCFAHAAIESRLLIATGQTYDPTNPRHDLSEQQLVVSRRQQHGDSSSSCALLAGSDVVPSHRCSAATALNH
jgi:hypothetical protein